MKQFQFLVDNQTKKDRPRDASNTVLLAFSRADAAKKFIVWSQTTYGYYVCDAIAEVTALIAETKPAEQCFYEVIFGESPQRLKFDIDQATPDQLAAVMNAIKRSWKSSSGSIGDYSTRRGSKIALFQTGPQSYHIVIDHFVDGVDRARAFFDDVCRDSPDVKDLLDSRVYSKIQNFRLIGNHKKDKEFVKTQINGAATFADTTISWRSR